MSVKTEPLKPASGISLFDAFGPNASEQAQAINQKAAELSMDDMARVMGLADKIQGTVDDHRTLMSGHHSELGSLISGLEVELVPDISALENAILSLRSHSLVVEAPRELKGYSTRNSLQWLSQASKSSRKIQESIESASSNMQRLLDGGVDGRTMVIAIKYNDPQTGVPRTLSIEDEPMTESHGGVRLVTRKRLQPR